METLPANRSPGSLAVRESSLILKTLQESSSAGIDYRSAINAALQAGFRKLQSPQDIVEANNSKQYDRIARYLCLQHPEQHFLADWAHASLEGIVSPFEQSNPAAVAEGLRHSNAIDPQLQSLEMYIRERRRAYDVFALVEKDKKMTPYTYTTSFPRLRQNIRSFLQEGRRIPGEMSGTLLALEYRLNTTLPATGIVILALTILSNNNFPPQLIEAACYTLSTLIPAGWGLGAYLHTSLYGTSQERTAMEKLSFGDKERYRELVKLEMLIAKPTNSDASTLLLVQK